MLIKSITLTNFQCYFGEKIFEFSEGLNVIIGDNGAGKSKLYDAFYWVLYDEIFDSTERKMRRTNEVKGKLVSDKARFLCESGGEVETIVEVVIYNASRDEEYTIARTYSISRIDTGNQSEYKWREPSESIRIVFKREKYLTAKLVKDPSEIKMIIRKILPSDIMPYVWFQGEQVDSLIDFKNKETLTDAINVLSDIKEFDFFVNVSKRAFESADNELRKERRRLSIDNGKSDGLENEKTRLEKTIERKEKELQDFNEGLTYAQERQDELQGQFDAAEKIQTLNREEKQVTIDLQRLDDDLKRLVLSVNKNLFNRFWAVKGTEHLVKLYEEKFGTYEKRLLEKKVEQEKRVEIENEVIKTLQMRLPKNVPEPEYVRWMLEEQRCLVCDREALTNSEPWLKIKELLEYKEPKPAQTKTTQLAKHNFQEEFKSLYQNGLRMQNRMADTDEEIRELFDNINKTRQRRSQVNEQLTHIRSQIQELINTSSISSPQSANILNEFKGQQEKIRSLDKQIQTCEHEIEQAKNRIKEIDRELKGLTKGQISPTLMEKVEVLEDFKTIATSTRERVFNRLIRQLEAEANKHYTAMTSENKAVRGQISLVKQPNGNYMPKIHDSEGREMHSINDSNIILIKMSVIMAIISAKKSTAATQLYPLISDAPTSKFTENYTIGFCRTVSEVFSQSIIMSKEFYLNLALRERLFKEVEKLGKVYIIEPSVPEGGRDNRNDLETIITKI
ncbi:MAG TPA: hypothetical protein PKA00_01800 [Saprospiraceae bacterium]|nr:hypothetical protein [Saprospiraceae bacterium]HMQ81604.1 hypothetical protein [Saprospiraceae bacterium]